MIIRRTTLLGEGLLPEHIDAMVEAGLLKAHAERQRTYWTTSPPSTWPQPHRGRWAARRDTAH